MEIFEVKKNKTFIAKKTNTFEEEKKVAATNPINEVTMDDITKDKPLKKKKLNIKSNFILVISDFYYYDSAKNLEIDLVKKTQINKFLVKKINDNKYRLLVGPFET